MARRRRPNCAAMPPLYQETAHTRLKLGTPAARRPLALAGLRLQTLIAKITSLLQTGRRLCFVVIDDGIRGELGAIEQSIFIFVASFKVQPVGPLILLARTDVVPVEVECFEFIDLRVRGVWRRVSLWR
jgi:hypothetical protein